MVTAAQIKNVIEVWNAVKETCPNLPDDAVYQVVSNLLNKQQRNAKPLAKQPKKPKRRKKKRPVQASSNAEVRPSSKKKKARKSKTKTKRSSKKLSSLPQGSVMTGLAGVTSSRGWKTVK